MVGFWGWGVCSFTIHLFEIHDKTLRSTSESSSKSTGLYTIVISSVFSCISFSFSSTLLLPVSTTTLFKSNRFSSQIFLMILKPSSCVFLANVISTKIAEYSFRRSSKDTSCDLAFTLKRSWSSNA